MGTFFDETGQKDSMLAGKNISLIRKMTKMVFDDFYLDKGYFKLLKRFWPSDKVIAWLGKRELTKILEIFQKRFITLDLRDFDL